MGSTLVIVPTVLTALEHARATASSRAYRAGDQAGHAEVVALLIGGANVVVFATRTAVEGPLAGVLSAAAQKGLPVKVLDEA